MLNIFFYLEGINWILSPIAKIIIFAVIYLEGKLGLLTDFSIFF